MGYLSHLEVNEHVALEDDVVKHKVDEEIPRVRADVLAQSDFRRTEKIEWIEKNEQDYEEILRKRECLSLKDLAVSGRDLIDAGVKPGKDVGEILNRMLEEVLDDPEKNDKEYLMSMYVTHEE